MTSRFLALFSFLMFAGIFDLSAQPNQYSTRADSYKIKVFDTTRTFSYNSDSVGGGDAGRYGISGRSEKVWRWDGEAEDRATYIIWPDSWNPEHNNGIDEYRYLGEYWATKHVRRPPSFFSTIPGGTTELKISGTFSSMAYSSWELATVGILRQQSLYGATLESPGGVWSGHGWLSSSDKLNSPIPSSYASYGVISPLIMVAAENGSWGWKNYPGVVEHRGFSNIPQSLLTKHIDVKIPIPANHSGRVRVTITGFIVSYTVFNVEYKAPATRGAGTNPGYYSDHYTGIAMLPVSSGSFLTFSEIKPILVGSLGVKPRLLQGSNGKISLKFSLWEK